MYSELDKRNLDIDVETALKQKRIRSRKKLPGESAKDQPIENAKDKFRVNVHNMVMDQVISRV